MRKWFWFLNPQSDAPGGLVCAVLLIMFSLIICWIL